MPTDHGSVRPRVPAQRTPARVAQLRADLAKARVELDDFGAAVACARLDELYVAQAHRRADDSSVVALRRLLGTTSAAHDVDASVRLAWNHLHNLGLTSEVVLRVLLEAATA